MEANYSLPESENTPATATSPPPELRSESVDRLLARLSKFDDLYFPRAVQSSATTAPLRESLLLDLLTRNAAVFLERYGSKLTSTELEEFDKLKGDYEINWHLKRLRSELSPTKEELKSRSTMTKNRRRAYMDKLVREGQYFSEDAMREREPYLHHELIGKFQDPSGRAMARPGERWSDTLMRRYDEAVLVQKIRFEQQRQGVPEEEWVGGGRLREEEQKREQDQKMEVGSVESDDDEEDEEEECKLADRGDTKTRVSRDAQIQDVEELPDAAPSDQQTTAEELSLELETLSLEEMQDRMEQFTFIMQQKFLSGEDQQHVDYSKIDADVSLDDRWIKEADDDAEEKYFDDV